MNIMVSMADTPDFEKQAKDAVTAVIAVDPMASAELVVPIICQHLSHATRMSEDPKPAVIAICRGSMKALLLGGRSVPDAAMALMGALPDMSLMMRAGPEDLMSWVMEGIADVTPLAGAGARDALREKIAEKYMGASAIFDAFCEAALKKGRGSAP